MATLAVEPVVLRLRSPLRAAWGELREREILRVRLTFGDDDWGEGEAAPLEPYDGVPLAVVRSALDAYASVAAAADPGELLAACAAERDFPQALAAIDLALWDRALRRGERERPGGPVPVNATVGAEDRAGAASAAAAAAAAGFRCVKVKVGVGDDAGRVAAVRAAVGERVALRVDANGAWRTPDEALANLEALAPSGIELCEEPMHGVDALRELRDRSPIPIAMDETHAPRSGAGDFVCLKITRSGGIGGVLRDAAAARAAGSGVYVSSTFDGPLGIAAGVHAAAVLMESGPMAACGLATSDALVARDGAITVPAGPGLL